MLWLKSCQRCRGDPMQEADKYGTYLECIQCGCQLEAEFATLRRIARPLGATVAAEAPSRPVGAVTPGGP